MKFLSLLWSKRDRKKTPVDPDVAPRLGTAPENSRTLPGPSAAKAMLDLLLAEVVPAAKANTIRGIKREYRDITEDVRIRVSSHYALVKMVDSDEWSRGWAIVALAKLHPAVFDEYKDLYGGRYRAFCNAAAKVVREE